MRRISWIGIVAIFGLVGCGSHACHTKSDPETKSSSEECPDCCSPQNRAKMLQDTKETPSAELKAITGEQLTREIERNSGKVVCVFLWGSYHPPSIRYLPEVVALQNKFAENGLVCLTACHAPPETRKMALQILQKAKCDFPSFAIDYEDSIAGKNGIALPGMVVIGRDGKNAATFDLTIHQPFGLPAIEEAVEKALSNK